MKCVRLLNIYQTFTTKTNGFHTRFSHKCVQFVTAALKSTKQWHRTPSRRLSPSCGARAWLASFVCVGWALPLLAHKQVEVFELMSCINHGLQK